MTSDLAIEIKKLADKYRNNKKTGLLDSDDFDNSSDFGEYEISNSNDEIDEFDHKKLDFLENGVDDFGDIDIEEEDLTNEIQIADFINPSISVVSDVEISSDIDVDGDIESGDKRKINEGLRIISRNIRDLKALLRS